jgi:hypothetical protein
MGIGSGISFSVQGVLQALSNLKATAVGEISNTLESLVGPWRPPQWAGPALTSITVPGVGGVTSNASLGRTSGALVDIPGLEILASTGVSTSTSGGTPPIIYVFDGVLQVDHAQEVQLTAHPIQTGANISDHAYQKPARVVMDILMSDAMDSYTAGQWTGHQSKSVNAYQIMVALEKARTPVTLTCRLDTYQNMVITAIHTRDDNKTKHGLRASITFQEVFLAQVQAPSAWSARPNDTSQFTGGLIQPTPVPDAITNNYFVEPPPVGTPTVTGAGNVSSNPVAADPGGS